MGRILSVQAVARTALGAALVFTLALAAGPVALALDAPAGSTNPGHHKARGQRPVAG